MPVTDANANLPATVPDQPRPQPRLWPLWIAAALLLLITLALSLSSWQQSQQQHSLQQALDYLERSNQRLEELSTRTDSQQSDRLRSLESQLRQQQERLAEQQRQLDHAARTLLEAGHRSRTDWLLAEAEYLLRIANQRLLLEQDQRGALAALTAADDVLRETDDIGVHPVREQLAKDKLALRGVSQADRPGIYLQLAAAIDSLSSLSDSALLDMARVTRSAETDAAEPDAQLNRWEQALHATRQALSQAIVIRRMDAPVQPLLSPEQSAYARLHLQLMLEEAGLAALRGHQALYDRALGRALAGLAQHFDSTNPQVSALTESLQTLQGKDINPTLPDISRSLALLKGRLEMRQSASSRAEGEAQ